MSSLGYWFSYLYFTVDYESFGLLNTYIYIHQPLWRILRFLWDPPALLSAELGGEALSTSGKCLMESGTAAPAAPGSSLEQWRNKGNVEQSSSGREQGALWSLLLSFSLSSSQSSSLPEESRGRKMKIKGSSAQAAFEKDFPPYRGICGVQP